MSKGMNTRKAMQSMTCRSVLAKYLEGQQLAHALRDLQDAMRVGPQAWAFKPKADEPVDERVYYQAGGAN